MSNFVTDCDYCGRIALCFEDEGHGTCCRSCSKEHDIAPLVGEAPRSIFGTDADPAAAAFEPEDDGQPTEYEEWQDVYGGDDWDHGQYDDYACEW